VQNYNEATALRELKDKVAKQGFVPLRDCSICGADIGFFPWADGEIGFDPSCDCGGEAASYRSDEDLAFYVRQEVFRKRWGIGEYAGDE